MEEYKEIIIKEVKKCVGSDGSIGNKVGMKLKEVNYVLRCNSKVEVENKMVIKK
jgi:hypothetical protein